MPSASERKNNELPIALIRNATLAVDTDGQPMKAKGRKLFGRRDAASDLCLVSNLQASTFCRALAASGKGWGLVAQAGGTFGYADIKLNPRKQGQELTSKDAYAYDMFAAGRSILKLLTRKHKQNLQAWEDSARLAAEDGPAGIRRMLETAVDQDVRVAQGTNVERLANLIAGVLHPDPNKRMLAQDAMLHAANTLPFLSPEHSLALASARGIVMDGGPVERLAVPYRKFPALQGKSLPPIALLPQADMGMGAQVLCALKKGDDAAVYGGKHILRTDTGILRRALPSRFSISVIGVEGFEAFVCDAAQTPERPFKWFVDNSVAGPFLNGEDCEGVHINCDLVRRSAWLDGEGGVWFVLRANRDIAAGEWLMWKYNWTAGAGIVIPGLTFAFD